MIVENVKQFIRGKAFIIKILLFVLVFYYLGKWFPLITNIILGTFLLFAGITIGMITYYRYVKPKFLDQEQMQDQADELLAEVDLEEIQE